MRAHESGIATTTVRRPVLRKARKSEDLPTHGLWLAARDGNHAHCTLLCAPESCLAGPLSLSPWYALKVRVAITLRLMWPCRGEDGAIADRGVERLAWLFWASPCNMSSLSPATSPPMAYASKVVSFGDVAGERGLQTGHFYQVAWTCAEQPGHGAGVFTRRVKATMRSHSSSCWW